MNQRAGIDMVSTAVLESQTSRLHHIIVWCIASWAVSVMVMALLMFSILFLPEEEVTETWTTTTTVDQDSGDDGLNNYAGGNLYYSGGDIVGETDSYNNDDVYADNDDEA